MRFQTSFEKMAQVTNGQIFAVCLVGLRVLLGVSCLYLVTQLPTLEVTQLQFAFIVPIVLLAVGVSLVFGILVRPFSLLAMLMTAMSTFLLIDIKTTPQAALPMLGLILLLGLFAAGGSGHVFGCDGIILRNLRRPNTATRFLFG